MQMEREKLNKSYIENVVNTERPLNTFTLMHVVQSQSLLGLPSEEFSQTTGSKRNF